MQVSDNLLRQDERTTSRLHVDRGLHVLRYISSAAGDDGPSVSVVVGPEAANKIKLVSCPDRPSALLAGPGSCLVVVSEASGTLRLEITARAPRGSLDAVLRLEQLEKAAREDAMSEPAPPIDARARRETFRFIAHLSRRGDVEVAEGEWAGGPEIPAALEGFTILGGPFEAQALALVGGERRWSSWGGARTFLGSRGRGQPLVGLRLRIEDGQQPQAELAVEAMFLGSPIVKKRGKLIELIGPFGLDPLVGLRIELVPIEERGQTAPRDSISKIEPRVQLFRPRVGRMSL